VKCVPGHRRGKEVRRGLGTALLGVAEKMDWVIGVPILVVGCFD